MGSGCGCGIGRSTKLAIHAASCCNSNAERDGEKDGEKDGERGDREEREGECGSQGRRLGNSRSVHSFNVSTPLEVHVEH